MNDCIFCKIIQAQIPSEKVYEDDYVYAFKDVQPQAPIHILIVPKKHYDNIMQVQDNNIHIAMLNAVQKIADNYNLKEGFRLVCNTGKQGGQSVEHLHFHILGGRDLQWPPG